MDHRNYAYYEANAANISLKDITSSKQNKKTLRRLRDGDDKLSHLSLSLSSEEWGDFLIKKGNDLGWLKYLRRLSIWNLPNEDEEWEEQQINAFLDGLARNQSIRTLDVNNLSDYGSTAILRALSNLTQLDELVYGCNNRGLNGCSTIGALLESRACKLKKLWLGHNNIGDDGVAALASGLKSIGPSLTYLGLLGNSIGNEGLSALVAALESCTSLETLDLSCNDFTSATAELGALSDWLQRDQMDLEHLTLQHCDINDEGLQALTEGATNHCKDLNLSGNDSITASGLRYLSTSLQSDTCHLESLLIGSINLRDDGAEVLARGLIGNQFLKCLHLCQVTPFTPAGWNAFITALCDTSSVNNTYLSNHTVHFEEPDEGFDIDESVVLYLQLNKEHPEHAARCKILMNHAHLNMAPLLQWELKFLPLAEVFQSRVLTSVYEFVRGMPKIVLERRDELALAAAYDEKIAMVGDESNRILRILKKRLREDVEERDRKITKLEEENKRLRGIVDSVRNSLED
ncbi:leucine-rich repeat protein [Skeletonema marinoi]|uniref:Leucine-rich repeat protein n=1 Tax=Skeletonema marinoi TaxID=267567 RepID=A0AAD8XUK5_9STRA|nr:leucine-rich repeat protein [Skeletonema marinoi]